MEPKDGAERLKQAPMAMPRQPPSMSVTMLNVGHGDAFLVKCHSPEAPTVNILVDAGPQKKRIVDRVASLLDPAEKPMIHLMVGTHYDADHLEGLIEIAKSRRFSIVEAWLPPILDEADPFSYLVGQDISLKSRWLAHRLLNHEEAIKDYLEE